MTNILELRAQIAARGLETYGDPSAIVAVKMGSEGLARLVSRRLHDGGLLANLVEYPAVGKGAARFRMQVMAKHSRDNIAEAVAIMARCHDEARQELIALQAPPLRHVA
jgi:glycine C-acetyltransferase